MQTASSILELLNSDKEFGLTRDIALSRLEEDGPNEIVTPRTTSAWKILVEQLKSSIVWLLIVAAIISLLTDEYWQALGIISAILINIIVGFFTEYRAKLSLEALRELSIGNVRVRRQGNEFNLPITELVRGDIVLLEAGVRVPADLRLLECANFTVDESALTGESLPVWKSVHVQEEQTLEKDCLFQGSNVLTGRAIAVVTATGKRTRLGKLGHVLEEIVPGEPPIAKTLDVFGQQLTVAVILLCIFFGLLGIARGLSLGRMLATSLALAAAAIPEGLPVVATVAMATGIRRMVKANVIVKQLSAIETLGCATVVCTDKTGTLTENKMLVSDLVLHNQHLQISGKGYDPIGELISKDGHSEVKLDNIYELLQAIVLCNDAHLEKHSGNEPWHIHGDPTEGALIVAATKLGLEEQAIREKFPRINEIPFDLNRKRMSTIHLRQDDALILFTKGSPEIIFQLCSSVASEKESSAFDENIRQQFNNKNQELAASGLRVLAVAKRNIGAVPDSYEAADIEKGLTLLGLVGMSDPPKEHVREAIEECKGAGVRVVMLTGDQIVTARAVANQLGIDEVLARVSAEMKLGIVQKFQSSGDIVAMTGDGINDAPALRQANIGIAMGGAGTDLAREAANLIITDDNFSTIIRAIEQGRLVYENIRRAVGYLLTASMTFVFTISLGLLINSGLFFYPLQLLYVNMLMHALPALGIVMQGKMGKVMEMPPRKQTEKLLGKEEIKQIIVRSTVISLITLIAITIDQKCLGGEADTTVAISIISFSLILQSWSWLFVPLSGSNKTEICINLLDIEQYINKPMLLSTLVAFIMVLGAIYIPELEHILNTKELDTPHLLIVFISSLLGYFFCTWGFSFKGKRLSSY